MNPPNNQYQKPNQVPPRQQAQAPRQETQALAPVDLGKNPLGLPSREEWIYIKEICRDALASGLLPSGIKTVEAAAIIALKARSLDIDLMTAFAHIAVINGKPAMSAELIQTQARRNLPGLIFNIIKTDAKSCIVEAQRPSKGSVPVRLEFTIEEAKAADLLTKQVWRAYPAAMLRARAITACLRMVCPDALMGVSYTPEELGVDDPNTIETTGRHVGPAVAAPESAQETSPEEPKPEEPKQETAAPGPVITPVVQDEEANLSQRRRSMWTKWKGAQGSPEGLTKYIKARFDLEPGQNLSLAQIEEIENYISEQINCRPPQPVDPQEPTPLPAAIKEVSDADDAEIPEWQKEVEQMKF